MKLFNSKAWHTIKVIGQLRFYFYGCLLMSMVITCVSNFILWRYSIENLSSLLFLYFINSVISLICLRIYWTLLENKFEIHENKEVHKSNLLDAAELYINNEYVSFFESKTFEGYISKQKIRKKIKQKVKEYEQYYFNTKTKRILIKDFKGLDIGQVDSFLKKKIKVKALEVEGIVSEYDDADFIEVGYYLSILEVINS